MTAVTNGVAAEDAVKHYTLGTHRICTPEETLARVKPLLAQMGITRIANVTGLDRIGIPVVTVARPNSRSGSVSHGKGLTLAAAKASGVMEAAELWHAENITVPTTLMSYEDMRSKYQVADPDLLPRRADHFTPDLLIPWVEGHDLMDGGEPVWVPYELVSADYTLPLRPGGGIFRGTTNGLSSGNHPLEAICHGLCEVVERDAAALWCLMGEARDDRGIDPSSVTDLECRSLLDRLDTNDLVVRIWDTTSDVGVASFCCLIAEADGEFTDGEFADPEYGCGCHPTREVALLRALTEAAQSRLGFISGTRDELSVNSWNSDYRRRRHKAFSARLNGTSSPRLDFGSVPSFTAPSLAGDLDRLLGRLRAVGVDQVIAVDLGHEELGIPVVRIVVPGLEGPNDETSEYTPGVRARRLLGVVP
jgi:YcaO-like protein with predicted kinase domain